ncbi:MAG: hypothetical protein ABH871_04015, partial [Pseudomonadota bacterium]
MLCAGDSTINTSAGGNRVLDGKPIPDGLTNPDTNGALREQTDAPSPDSVLTDTSNLLLSLANPQFGPLTLWIERPSNGVEQGTDSVSNEEVLAKNLTTGADLLAKSQFEQAKFVYQLILRDNPENEAALKLYQYASNRAYEREQLGEDFFEKLPKALKSVEGSADPLSDKKIAGLILLDALDKIDYIHPYSGKAGLPPVQAQAARDKIIKFLKGDEVEGVTPTSLVHDVQVLQRYSKYLLQLTAARQAFVSRLPVYVQQHIEKTQSYKMLRLYYEEGSPDIPSDWPINSTKDDDGNIIATGLNDSTLVTMHLQESGKDAGLAAKRKAAFSILQEDVLPALPDLEVGIPMPFGDVNQTAPDFAALLRNGAPSTNDPVVLGSRHVLRMPASSLTLQPSAVSIEELERRLNQLEAKLDAAKLGDFLKRIEEHELDEAKKNPGFQAREGVTAAEQNLVETARVLKEIDDGIASKKPIDEKSFDDIARSLITQTIKTASRLNKLTQDPLYKRDGSLNAALGTTKRILENLESLSANDKAAIQKIQTAYRLLAQAQAAELKAHMLANAINVGLVGADPVEGALRSVSHVSVQFGGPSIDRKDYDAYLKDRGIAPGQPIVVSDIVNQVLLWKVQKSQSKGTAVPGLTKPFNNQPVSDMLAWQTGLDTAFTVWGTQEFQSAKDVVKLLAKSQEVIQTQDRLALRDTIEGARSEVIDLKMEVGQDRLLRERLPTGVYDYVISQYNQALTAFDKGDLRTAQAIFLKARNGAHRGAQISFEDYQTDRTIEKYTIGVAIIIASAGIGSAFAGAVMGGEVAFGEAGWFAYTALSTAGFWAASTAGNALLLGEAPEYFRSTEAADIAKGVSLDLATTYGMFLFLGGGMGTYRDIFVKKVFQPKAAAELAKLGIRDVSSAEGQAMLRQMVLAQEKNLPLLAKSLYRGGMFSTEYGVFTIWDRIALNIDTIYEGWRGPNKAELDNFFSTASMLDRLSFLSCLKFGNTFAHQAFQGMSQKGLKPEVRGFLDARAKYVTDLKTFMESNPKAEDMPAKIEEFRSRGARLAKLGVQLKDKLPAEVHKMLEQDLGELARFAQLEAAHNTMPGQYVPKPGNIIVKVLQRVAGKDVPLLLRLLPAAMAMPGFSWIPERPQSKSQAPRITHINDVLGKDLIANRNAVLETGYLESLDRLNLSEIPEAQRKAIDKLASEFNPLTDNFESVSASLQSSAEARYFALTLYRMLGGRSDSLSTKIQLISNKIGKGNSSEHTSAIAENQTAAIDDALSKQIRNIKGISTKVSNKLKELGLIVDPKVKWSIIQELLQSEIPGMNADNLWNRTAQQIQKPKGARGELFTLVMFQTRLREGLTRVLNDHAPRVNLTPELFASSSTPRFNEDSSIVDQVAQDAARAQAHGHTLDESYLHRHITPEIMKFLKDNPSVNVRIYDGSPGRALHDLRRNDFTEIRLLSDNKLTDFHKYIARNPSTGETSLVVIGLKGRAYPKEIAAHFLYGHSAISPSRIKVLRTPGTARVEFAATLRQTNIDPD